MDRPDEDKKKVRIASPFTIESTIQSVDDLQSNTHKSDDFIEVMIGTMRQVGQMSTPGKSKLNFEDIRRVNDYEHIHAECTFIAADGDKQTAAIAFGPEDGVVGSSLVVGACSSAVGSYKNLFFFGFNIHAKAREVLKTSRVARKMNVEFVNVAHDVVMYDLLKTGRTSEVFSIVGKPDVSLETARKKDGVQHYQVHIVGLDVFHPDSMETEHLDAKELACWMVDPNYDETAFFYPTQVGFPSTDAWNDMEKALKAKSDDDVWENLGYLQGITSTPFSIGETGQVAIKVINPRGDEVMTICSKEDAVESKAIKKEKR